MEIKKGHVIAALLILVALAGTGAVYQFYVKERLAELQTHVQQESELRARITKMEDTFFRTRPEVVLAAWSRQTQPWLDAVGDRTDFFSMGATPGAREVPEEVIAPKFYYAEEYPKMMDRLNQLAYRNKTTLGNIDFGVPNPDGLSGQNPSREEVSEWLTKLESVITMATLFIDADALPIDAINIWPPRDGPGGVRGKVVYRTTGVRMTISPENLEAFLKRLTLEDRYFSVDGIWIYNKTLRNPRAPLSVELLLTQARFEEGASGGAAGGAGGGAVDLAQSSSTFAAFFSSRPTASQPAEQPSWWQNFRRKWLPF